MRGCLTHEVGLAGEPVTHFSFHYTTGLKHGDIYVYSVGDRRDRLEVVVVLHEYR